MDDLLNLNSVKRMASDTYYVLSWRSVGSSSTTFMAESHLTRFKEGKQQKDLDKAISGYKRAIEIQSPSHPWLRILTPDELGSGSSSSYFRTLLGDRCLRLANLMHARLKSEGPQGNCGQQQQRDLDDAILLHRQDLQLRPPHEHPEASRSLNNLANLLHERFKLGGQQDDLDDAILFLRQAVEVTPATDPPLRSRSLHNLGNTLHVRFQEGGQQTDLDEAISLFQQALQLKSPSHPSPSRNSNNSLVLICLASALHTRFQQGGQQTDLDESILLRRQNLELLPPSHSRRPSALNDLASALRTRFEQGLHQYDLDEAIVLHRQAFQLQTPTDPKHSLPLSLAIFLQTRFKPGDTPHADLEERISTLRQDLQVQPPSHPDRIYTLSNLANSLHARFLAGRPSQQTDLDETILFQQQALQLDPPSPLIHSTLLDNLSLSMHVRFKKTAQQTDLDEALSLHARAFQLDPSHHFAHSNLLNNLAMSLHTLSLKTAAQTDLKEAISLLRLALLVDPLSDRWRSSSITNLAIVLKRRFELRGRQKDLDESISLNRQGLELCHPSDPYRSNAMSNLAVVLRMRFERSRSEADLFESISLQRMALDLRPGLHPSRSASLYSLGELLIHVHSLSTTDNPVYLDEAMSAFFAATQSLSQSPAQRLKIAKAWIRSAKKYQHARELEAYTAALEALPHLAALSMGLQARHEALGRGGIDGLARDASTCAIRAGDLHKAIEFLEAGRTILWSQVLSLRSSFDQLDDIAPGLAQKLRGVARTLEAGSHRDASTSVPTEISVLDNQKKLAVDKETARLNELNEEWSKTIEEVRNLVGFEDFLRPRRLSTLQVRGIPTANTETSTTSETLPSKLVGSV
ncbi:hypothetical protein GALMADRAFT_145339 [Galerina marginata CBS 339.88]|uniref:Anaphase-promoting complex subunit 5 domain-containing protein n=1 Tax=Galerina marginata (strain CBS 339.88) TaxID=685588 RepID=A0A067SPI7_GALM3|nr:hypothetical protein GALMADRAFT_145339 [Galerina marginata CBS 339.88]